MAPLQLNFIVPVKDLVHTDTTFSATIDLKDLAEHDHPAGPAYRVRDIKAQIRKSGTGIDSRCEFVIDGEIFRNDHIVPTQQLRQPITLAPPRSNEVEITLWDSRSDRHTLSAPWEADLAWIQRALGRKGIELDLVGTSRKVSLMDTYLTTRHKLSDFDLGEQDNILDVSDVFCRNSDRIDICVTDCNRYLGGGLHPDQPIRHLLDNWVCMTGQDPYDFRALFNGHRIEYWNETVTPSTLDMRSGDVIEIFRESRGGGPPGAECTQRIVHIDSKRPAMALVETAASVCYDFIVRRGPQSSRSADEHDDHFDYTSQTYMSEGGYWVEVKTVKVADNSNGVDDASG